MKLSEERFIEELENLDSEAIEKAIITHFALTADDGTYGVKFPLWDTSNSCAGEKYGANEDKYLTLATDTEYEDTNYGEAFTTYDCNAYVDSDGVVHVTALKGMSNFVDTGEVDVYVLLRTKYEKFYNDGEYVYYERRYLPKDGYAPCPQSICRDGSIRPYYLIPKYIAGRINDILYSSKGLIPAHYVNASTNTSFTGSATEFHKKGDYYCATSMADASHLATTIWLKFATRNSQSVIAGNTSNNYQYQVAYAEENVTRVVLTTTQANYFDLKTYVTIGDYADNTNKDRYYYYMHDIVYSAEIIDKEVIDDNYTALILDCDAFTTTETTYVSSWHETSGFSDEVLGRNGSRVSNTNGKHGAVIDGIECFVGGYEVAGNAFLDISDESGTRDVYITNDASVISSTIATDLANFTKLEAQIKMTNMGAWNYITEEELDLNYGALIPVSGGVSGSGSAVGYADGCYIDTSTSGQREVLMLGPLSCGAAAGVSCVATTASVGTAFWHILARPSICVGGELSA